MSPKVVNEFGPLLDGAQRLIDVTAGHFERVTPVARQDYLFTSESVSEGHPDKVCDRISDEIVDLVYREAKKTGMDPWKVRVACETLATTNRVVIAGEVRVPDTLLKKDKAGNT